MNEKERITLSKFLAYILRHNPSAVGISLDDAAGPTWMSSSRI